MPPRIRLPGSLVIGPSDANELPARAAPPVSHLPPVSMAVMASSWRFANTAPFGRPVVPEVNTIATGRAGSSARGGTSGGASNDGTIGVDSSMVMAGSATANNCARSPLVSRVLIPAVTAPMRAAPR